METFSIEGLLKSFLRVGGCKMLFLSRALEFKSGVGSRSGSGSWKLKEAQLFEKPKRKLGSFFRILRSRSGSWEAFSDRSGSLEAFCEKSLSFRPLV
ncbi:CLUMA_CG000444, isoform A [Clunio marinus]|uniref:CLUMA_CG000444, isoform A n=1 Tax=Clunio marinus TaxID=568069 RepID=A0A1J1HJF6_9DIPT|nr:CLUMA_CG000444, isoform A [Clunio marinus]